MESLRASFSIDQILYEDDVLIAFNKPCGLPTQPTVDGARNNLYQEAKRAIAERDQVDPEKVYLGLHHRLDRDTSGIIVMTKDPSVNKPVSEWFAKKTIEKTYVALSAQIEKRGTPKVLDKSFTVKNYLGVVGKKRNIRIYGAVRSGGDYAETEFHVLGQGAGRGGVPLYLLHAHPKTGRTHQIRTHLAAMGLPILGDVWYAPESVLAMAPRLMLHAESLEFIHPKTQKKLKILAPLPPEFSVS